MKKTSGTDWERLNAMSDEDIDTSDIPELDDNFFQQAELHLPVKKPVTIRLDADVLEWFKGQGQGYQTRINNLLRKYMETHQNR
ncbi:MULTISPECIES: BrnA antitoxin family protein [unclassified Endozoicomonas]|uniref:BrnA antitoxin family protein n=1 Tax=unclassified Endozoicomonas TaxID=2644528 RepID=UPI0021475F4F|nr:MULTISPECIES: BrnA antitoxin family protein [unclassified Endozoicomonas]WBA80897.1 BrnA antitoxin family protein [Endozoicomonas sp. GU-1]WBA88462.1 BrnA antitoxin family protein [Endozoicomonas sp. GU-1]